MKKKNLFRCFFSCLLVLSMCMTGIHAQETTGWNDHAHSDARVTVDAQSDQAFDSTENYALNKEASVSGLEVPDRLLGPEAVDGSLDTAGQPHRMKKNNGSSSIWVRPIRSI